MGNSQAESGFTTLTRVPRGRPRKDRPEAIVSTNVRLPESLLTELRVEAATSGDPIQDIVADAIRAELDRRSNTPTDHTP